MDLSAPCIERGGTSTQHKGVLAEFLNSTIPSGRIILAHGCNNGKCSNPRHLYWATDRENIIEDGIEFGTWKSTWQRMVDKYGLEEAKRMNGLNRDHSRSGKGNTGKPKSEEHRRKISEAIRRKNLLKKETIEEPIS